MGWPRIAMPRDIGIVCLGDSHTEGKLPSVTSGANVTGIYPLNGSRDLDWDGSADRTPFRGVNHINVSTGTQDGNCGVAANNASFSIYLPQILRRCSPRVGRVRIANGGIGGSSSFSWSSNVAKGYLLVNSLPNVNDTFTLGSTTYTFVAAAANPNEITIAGTVLAQATNIANAINAEGTGWGAGTTANADGFVSPLPSNGYVGILSTASGTAGNGVTLSVNAGGRVTVFVAMSGGTAASSLLTNMIARVPAGFGPVDIVTITLGTNDSTIVGWRGRGFETHMATFLAAVEAQWPNAKVVLWKPPVTTAGAAATTALTTRINPAVAALVAANPTVRSYVDMYSLGAGAAETLILDSGGVHLTGYGYSLVAEAFAGAIATALGI